jgi:L-alanine-DL-glutamate epimerase-like enolase superfamily enzyme
MRAHLGPDFPLMVDANMGWTVPQAIQAARAFEPFNLVWMEEPIDPDNIDGHKAIVDAAAVPIATGENLRSLAEFRHLIQAGGVHYPEPDPTNCGGISAFMKVARLAEAHGLPVTSHGVHDICVHLLAAAPNRARLEIHGFSLDPYIEEPLQLVEGCAIAPELPGHGVRFQWDKLKAFK